MLPSGRFFRILPLLALGVWAAVAASAARAEDDVRFSATLTPAQRERIGLNQLTADNVAIIDGLVRQDLAALKYKNNEVEHTRFSERRTPRERDIAGLDRLSPAQLTELDNLAGQRILGTMTVPNAAVAHLVGPAVKPGDSSHPPVIHGEIGFTYGWGQGGSVSGGDIVLTYDDPAGRYSVLFAYSEYHGKGLLPCYYPGYGTYPFRPGVIPMSR
jgi:hypothetical protein